MTLPINPRGLIPLIGGLFLLWKLSRDRTPGINDAILSESATKRRTTLRLLGVLVVIFGLNETFWPSLAQRLTLESPPDGCVCGATDWFRFSAEPSGFSALMPMPPTTSLVTNETAAGPLVVSTFRSDISPTVTFAILHNSFPTNIPMTDTEQRFAGGLKAALGADGHLSYEHVVSLNGYPSREWRFEKNRGQVVVTMRASFVGRDFYQAISVMPRGRVCQRHVAEFLNSCQLKSE